MPAHFGAEGTGLPEEILARGDAAVRIPMVGTAESLNLAVAAGLLLYEAQRAGGLDPGGDGLGPRDGLDPA